MDSVFHRAKQRRAERAPVMASGNINLVPLVDILTAIVFFSLLTYQGATMAALTSFDLSLPPVVVNTPEQLSRIKSEKDVLNLLLAVRVDNDKLTVEHSEEGGFHQVIQGLDKPSLDQLEALMTSIRNKYPQNADVTVIPADEVSYANVVHVLERLKLSHFTGISLTTKARGAASGA
ncbi:MAG: biopolymer transporter ExbD [Gemmatimonadaceae bacterium]|nr:biopolymer transporter ExbD [Gemmatimonadaceae bacterium]